MERLTNREYGEISCTGREIPCSSFCNNCSQGTGNCEIVKRMVEKLADYEDLEERGRLLKLPCDKVYYIVDKNNPKYTAVMSKAIRDLTVYEIENIDIDGRYFSTKELAEAKLKELRGNQNEV
jgi:hypothetical protein